MTLWALFHALRAALSMTLLAVFHALRNTVFCPILRAHGPRSRWGYLTLGPATGRGSSRSSWLLTPRTEADHDDETD